MGFAESIINALIDMPDAPPQAKAMIGLIRSSKLRNEIYYDDDKMEYRRELLRHHVCDRIPPQLIMSKLGDVLDGVTRVSIEGLPYDWELVFDLKNVNPTPFFDDCKKYFNPRSLCRSSGMCSTE